MPGNLHSESAPEPAESSDDELEVDTLDEALALALSLCPDGESISLHEAHCEVTADRPEKCTCDAQIFRPVRA